MSRQRSEIVGIPSWGLATLTSFFQIGKAHQAFTIQTARGEHQVGRLPLAMSSPQEFTAGVVIFVSFCRLRQGALALEAGRRLC